MANDTIKGAGDIYEKDLYGDISKSGKDYIRVLESINDLLAEQSKSFKSASNIDPQDIKGIKELNKSIDQTNEAYERKIKVNKEILKVKKQVLDAESQEAQSLVDLDLKTQKLSASKAALLKRQKQADAQRRAGNEDIAKQLDLTEKERVQLSSITQELTLANLQKSKARKLNKEQISEVAGLTDEYQKQSKRLGLLRKEFKNLILEEGKSTKETKRLEKEITKLDRTLKDVDEAAGQFQRNVGNYPDTLGKAAKSLAILAAGAISLDAAFDGVSSSLNQSAEGSENVREVTSKLGGVFDQVKDVVASAALDVFEYGSAVVEAVSNGEGLIDSLTDTEDKFKRVSKSTEDFTDKALESANAQAALTKRIIEFEKAQRPLEVSLSRLNGLISQQQIIAGDSTRSFETINSAILKGQELQIQRSSINVRIAKEELELAKERIRVANLSTGAGVDLLDQETSAITKLIDAKNELKNEILENEKEIRQVKQDSLEIDLDILIDGFDNQKTINERIIANEKETLEVRSALLQKTAKLAEDSFRGQTKVLEELSSAGIDVNKLLGLDATQLADQIKLLKQSEIINTRTLEVVRERKIVIQDLEDAQEELNESEQDSIDIRKDILAQEEALGKITQESVEQSNEALETLEKDREQNEIANLRRRLSLSKEGSVEFLNIQRDLNDALLGEQEKRIKLQEESEKAAAEERKKIIGDSIEIIGDLINDNFEKTLENIDKKLEATSSNIDRLRSKADQGRLDSDESIAFEQKQEAELERERERTLKKQERTKAFFAVLTSFNANNGSIPDTAADSIALKAIANGLTAFDGVDDTGDRGNLDSKGGKAWILHPREQVLSYKDRQEVKDPTTGKMRTREELKEIVKMHDSGMGLLNPSAYSLNSLNSVSMSSNLDTKILESKFDMLNSSINNISIPEGTVSIDQVRGLMELIIKKGNKINITKSKLRG